MIEFHNSCVHVENILPKYIIFISLKEYMQNLGNCDYSWVSEIQTIAITIDFNLCIFNFSIVKPIIFLIKMHVNNYQNCKAIDSFIVKLKL